MHWGLLAYYAAKLISEISAKNAPLAASGILSWECSIPNIGDLIPGLLTRSFGFALASKANGTQSFARGDHVHGLPPGKKVAWADWPVTLVIRYKHEARKTTALFQFALKSGTQYDENGKRFFDDMCKGELERYGQEVDALLENAAASCRTAKEGGQDGAASADENALRESATRIQAAYAELDVPFSATWDDVQAAYRRECKKYHPDTMSSCEVPAHIRELATQKFDRVTKAYVLIGDFFEAVAAMDAQAATDRSMS